jgi:hypothetical protein
MTTSNCHRRSDCRLCGSEELELVLGLAATPPANAFVPADRLDEEQERFPLDVFQCRDCGHVQLLDVVDPEILFADYVYVSGTSPVFVKHFEDYAAKVMADYAPPAGALAFDIGSNDGTLLGFFQKGGLKALGVDPARAIAADATARGIETLNAFFDRPLAEKIRSERGPAHVITANNVFAHADDLGGIADGIAELLHDDGVFVFEVSYLLDVYEGTLFDTIYHEHVAYHTVEPLTGFFRRHGLELVAAERIGTHGGSLRGYVRKAGRGKVDASVGELIALEQAAGLNDPATLKAFGAKIEAVGAELRRIIGEAREQGRRIAAFGAPAKATTLMYQFGLEAADIEFIIDDSPLKQGRYSPGKHIPVLPATAIAEKKPDDLVILAWNFADSIMDKHRAFCEEGGRFIVPLPSIRVV